MVRLTDLRRRLTWWAKLASTMIAFLFLIPSAADAAPCTANCLTPGDYNIVANHAGQTRTYRVHVPVSYRNGTSTALVLDIHGFTSYDQVQRAGSGQLEQSNKRGFIAVWPQGLYFPSSWNGYVCCWTAYDKKVDDVGFFRRIVMDLKARADIDPERVYATGLSNGALMSHRLACEAADVFRAVAPVSFTRNAPNYDYKPVYGCTPSRPVTVVEFHGTADDAVRYDGSTDRKFESAPASLVSWKNTLACPGPSTTRAINAKVRVETYSGCRGGVSTALVTVQDGPHDLYQKSQAGMPDHLDIAEYIWTNVFR